jgi:hypothetical protein
LDENAIEFISKNDSSLKEILHKSIPSFSGIFGPTSDLISEPIIGKEGISLANINLFESIKWKKVHDITGGYNRFDIFRLSMIKKRYRPLDIFEE